MRVKTSSSWQTLKNIYDNKSVSEIDTNLYLFIYLLLLSRAFFISAVWFYVGFFLLFFWGGRVFCFNQKLWSVNNLSWGHWDDLVPSQSPACGFVLRSGAHSASFSQEKQTNKKKKIWNTDCFDSKRPECLRDVDMINFTLLFGKAKFWHLDLRCLPPRLIS